MIVQWYAHLPGVALQSSRELSFGAGKLAHVPFDEWHQLDDAFSFNESHYKQSRPVFYTGEADFPEDLDIAREFIHKSIHMLYLAFLLEQEVPLLPAPEMSVTYLRIPRVIDDNTPAGSYYEREIGPFEREWIVFERSGRTTFDDARLSSVRWAYSQVAAFDPDNAFSGVAAGLDTLELTARPEFWWHNEGIDLINGFVHCMAALEHILLPSHDEAPTGMKLTPTFGQHAAVITKASRKDLQQRAKHFSALYRLRSRLVHGEMGLTQLTDQEWSFLDEGRELLRYVLLKAMELRKVNKDYDSLSLLLAQAFKNDDVHRSLFS